MLQLSFHPFPVLKTERFLLRQMTMDDIHEIFALRSDDRVNEFLDRAKAHTLEDVRKFVNKIDKGIRNNESVFWVIVPENEIKLVGTICLWNISRENDRAEIGYELLPEHRGKGIIQEAIKKVIEFGFSSIKLRTIEACLRIDNYKSVKVLERNNFKRDTATGDKTDEAKNEKDMVLYSLQNTGK